MSDSEHAEDSPRIGIGVIVDHPAFGRGRVISYDGDRYVVAFRGGESKKVAFSYDSMRPVETGGDPELDRFRQAVAEVLGDYGWLDSELEMAARWQGGTLRMMPGNEETLHKDIPIDVFFKKIIGVREKLRVLEQKINNHASLSSGEKLELEGYLTRAYGSLTTFNALFADRESQFKGQS